MNCQLLHGDCRKVLKTLPDESVHCCVTSPPYFGLRDYGVDGQTGLEPTPDAYVAELVAVFREVRRVLRDDGTLWLNLGDSYGTGTTAVRKQGSRGLGVGTGQAQDAVPRCGGMAKQLLGIPWSVAFALQADGWYLRQDIIWHKPNPMPESVTDRCTKAHEYVFLLSKSERYYFDQEAIAEAALSREREREKGNGESAVDTKQRGHGSHCGTGRTGKNAFRGQGANRDTDAGPANRDGRDMKDIGAGITRNKRSVWTVNTRPYKEAHFATFPPALITPMILAGCPTGGTVLDCFGGSGTTGEVAESLGRNSILIELNPAYIELQGRRTAQMGMAI